MNIALKSVVVGLGRGLALETLNESPDVVAADAGAAFSPALLPFAAAAVGPRAANKAVVKAFPPNGAAVVLAAPLVALGKLAPVFTLPKAGGLVF